MSFKAIKVETEAEGSTWKNIENLRVVSRISGLPLYLKIGGPEAKTDTLMAVEQGVDGLIAPMVESPFAAEKFANMTANLGFTWLGITIETVTALRNLKEIAKVAAEAGMSGLTLGRGDFCASAKIKGQEDSAEMMNYAREFIDVAGGFSLNLGMGGNLQRSSILFAHDLGSRLDFIESRRVVLKNSFDLEEMEAQVELALNWELTQIREAKQDLELTIASMDGRIQTLAERLRVETSGDLGE